VSNTSNVLVTLAFVSLKNKKIYRMSKKYTEWLRTEYREIIEIVVLVITKQKVWMELESRVIMSIIDYSKYYKAVHNHA